MGIRINGMAENDPLFEIRDRAVVVAGAGGGLGGETARALHGRGARLILFDIDEARLRAVEADCPGAVARVADITDEAQLRTVTAKGMEGIRPNRRGGQRRRPFPDRAVAGRRRGNLSRMH